jgi:hypothetical protein
MMENLSAGMKLYLYLIWPTLADYAEALDWDAVDWLDWARANRN